MKKKSCHLENGCWSCWDNGEERGTMLFAYFILISRRKKIVSEASTFAFKSIYKHADIVF